MKGYKVFNADWTCRGFKYEVGKTFEEKVSPSVCHKGFHYCEQAIDCFEYYNFDPNNKVAEIFAHGEISTEGNKSSTNKIEILREISWEEVLKIVNLGKSNTGRGNTGNGNTGNWNTGDRNTGNWNTGNGNTGNWNTGNRNTGNGNTGNWNTGNRNTGDGNTGNRNTGDQCTGDFNLSDNETGCFNTEVHKIRFFDIESDLTINEWRSSMAYKLLSEIEFIPTKWIYSEDMSEEEKRKYTTHETTGGYLKTIDLTDVNNKWWNSLSEKDKNIIKSIPNFDALKFEQITGIKAE